jgi:hypothetical protein
MKKLLSCVAIVLSCYTIQAQTLTVNNTSSGDVYLKVFAVPSTCSPTVLDYVDIMVPAGQTGGINLGIPSNWNSGAPPAGSYELEFAYVSRDPSCTGSFGWGAPAGTCTGGVSMYYDEVLVGDVACSYSGIYCLEATFAGAFCGGFQSGDVVNVSFNTLSLNVTIDITP